MRVAPALCLGLAVMTACATRHTPAPDAPPAALIGSFTDDYGSTYQVSATEWRHGPSARYHIVRWNVAGQYLIAQNDPANPGDGGLWTRIDWLPLPGMSPYTWGYCYSAYKAPSAAIAETVSVAKRSVPRTGCNGFPFSRMRAVADSGK